MNLKTTINNDFLIDKYGYSLDENLKDNNHLNADKVIDIAYRAVCDNVLENNIYLKTYDDIEEELNSNVFKQRAFKEAIALQVIFIMENADLRFIHQERENISPAVKRILKNTLNLYHRARYVR